MGYNASLKCFISQLQHVTDVRGDQLLNQFEWSGCRFSRVWLQGVVVSIVPDVGLYLDDGTGCIVVQADQMSKGFSSSISIGSYVQAIGFLGRLEVQGGAGNELLCTGNAIVVELQDDPDQETLWLLEVMDAQTAVVSGAIQRV